MEKILQTFGDRFRYIKYRPQDPINTWVLGIRGEIIEVDGRAQLTKDHKIYSHSFEGILNQI
jgi:hypothetical protein